VKEETVMSIERVKTGIEGFDQLVGGGFQGIA